MNELLLLRHERGLKRADFAVFLGIPIRTYEKWETGERTPPEWVVSLIKFKCEKSNQGEQMTINDLEKSNDDIIAPSAIKETFNVLCVDYVSGFKSLKLYKENDPLFDADVKFRQSEDKKDYKYNPTWETFKVFRI